MIIIAGVVIVILIILVLLFLNKKPTLDTDYVYSSSKPHISKFIPLSSKGPIPISNVMNHYVADELYGQFEITEKKSKKLVVLSEHYYEVTIYSLPSWDIIYSETNIHELDLSFLKPGKYSLIIHSLSEIKAKLFSIKYENIPSPKSKIYYSGTEDLYDTVALVYDKVVEILSNDNLLPSSENYSSQLENKWPYMIRTQIEKLEFLPQSNFVVIIASNKYQLNISGDIDEIPNKLLYNEQGLVAYQLNGGINYNIFQINENLSDNANSLPIYAYSFN